MGGNDWNMDIDRCPQMPRVWRTESEIKYLNQAQYDTLYLI